MSYIDNVQKYLDDIYPASSTLDGVATRLALNTSTTQSALRWLVAQHRAVEVSPGLTVPDAVQYQSTKTVRAVSRGFDGSMDNNGG